MQCHIVFDIKKEDFRHEAMLMAGINMTEALATFTFASIVSRETVEIALMIVAFNDLEVKLGDMFYA